MAERPRACSSSEDPFFDGEGEEEEADDGAGLKESFFPSPWNNRRDSLGLITRTSSIFLLSIAAGTAKLFYRANPIPDIHRSKDANKFE